MALDGIDFGALSQALGNENIDGTVRLSLNVTGPSNDPRINGDLAINNGKMNILAFRSFSGDFRYLGRLLSWDFGLNLDRKNRINITGHVPVIVDLSDSLMLKMLDHEPFALNVNCHNVMVDSISGQKNTLKIGGLLNCDVNIGNTIAQPDIDGSIRFHKGTLTNNIYGISYKDITLQASLLNNRI